MPERPRQLTDDEVQEKFLNQVRVLVDWWENDTRVPTSREKLEGLAFSIMVILDGGSGIPSFAVIPMPHEDDKEYCRSEGENWWPQADGEFKHDIAGRLHDQLWKKK